MKPIEFPRSMSAQELATFLLKEFAPEDRFEIIPKKTGAFTQYTIYIILAVRAPNGTLDLGIEP